MTLSREKMRKDYCYSCGPQRCDGSDEMMNYCATFLQANWQGLCAHCVRALWCPDSRRWLDMKECSQFIDSKVLKCDS